MARSKDYISLINSQRWKSLRRYHLSGHQWCERCLRNGRHTPASEVHHVIPVESVFGLEAMKRLMFDPLNLMSVCRQCHCNIHTELGSRSTMLRRSKREREVTGFIEEVFGGGDSGDPGGVF